MEPELKKRLLRNVLDGEAHILTSAVASPTGFPFKVVQMEGTLSDPEVYEARSRICDLGFLRNLFKKEDGSLGYRCSAEQVDDYVRKGGNVEDTVGRTCLCNNLHATAGFAQTRKDGYVEPPLITLGDDLMAVSQFLKGGTTSYSAKDVVTYLLSP